MAKAKSSVPAGHHTVTPHLIMNDASSALDWYAKALGAEILARAPGPDGKIMHAEIRVGTSIIMLNDEMGGGRSAKALGGSPVSLWVYVDDCDALFKRAVVFASCDSISATRFSTASIDGSPAYLPQAFNSRSASSSASRLSSKRRAFSIATSANAASESSRAICCGA